jgi:general secretion pathway protein F
MAAAGERSGELENLLERAAGAMDEEVDTAVQTLSAMMEPAVVLVMAGMVLFVLLAVMLPVFEMNQLVR